MRARKEKARFLVSGEVDAGRATVDGRHRHIHCTATYPPCQDRVALMHEARRKGVAAARAGQYDLAARHLDLFYRLRRQLAPGGGRR